MLHRRAVLVSALGAVLLVAMIGTAGASGAHHPAVTVSPAVAGPHARFTVRFHAPAAAGISPTQRSWYAISASTKSGAGCRASVSRTISPARKGQLERVHLSAGGSSRLCAGTYQGSVTLMRMPVCGPTAIACTAAVVVTSQPVGRFRFRVN